MKKANPPKSVKTEKIFIFASKSLKRNRVANKKETFPAENAEKVSLLKAYSGEVSRTDRIYYTKCASYSLFQRQYYLKKTHLLSRYVCYYCNEKAVR